MNGGWSEDRLHRWLARRTSPRGLAGSTGHDAAVLRALAPDGHPVTCVDACIEGVHFEPGAPARSVGRKAANRALSDLAATAARPVALLLAVRAPAERPEPELRGWIDGVARAAAAVGAELVGGDLSAAEGAPSLTVTALGTWTPAARLRRPPGRDRALEGHSLLVTGPLGGSLLGRHLRFTPRIDAGLSLAELGATALMDVSDGLAWDAFRLARASGLALALDLDSVPVHRDARRAARTSGRTALDHALHDGEDHELLAALPRARVAAALESLPGTREIGRFEEGRGLWMVQGERRRRWKPEHGGWKHGTT